MKQLTVVLHLAKTTKNTHVYKVAEDQSGLVSPDTIYLQKRDAGATPPNSIKVTVVDATIEEA